VSGPKERNAAVGKIKMATDIASAAVSNARRDVNSGVGGEDGATDDRAEEREDEAEDEAEDGARRRHSPRAAVEPPRERGATPTDTANAATAVLLVLAKDEARAVSADKEDDSLPGAAEATTSTAGSGDYARDDDMSGNKDAPPDDSSSPNPLASDGSTPELPQGDDQSIIIYYCCCCC
jgi:hypothetical protein